MGHPDLIRAARTRTAALLGAIVLIGLGAAPATATRYGPRVPGPRTLATGFSDSFTLASDDRSLRSVWYAHARASDSSWARLVADWAAIAPQPLATGSDPTNPANPGYSWNALDAVVRSAVAAHQRVLLTIIDAPAWAEGPNPPPDTPSGSWMPSAPDLGQFAQALATRYDGSYRDPAAPRTASLPAVADYQVWNEENTPLYLSPQWTSAGRGFAPAGPALYRAMLNAAYAGITAAQRHAFVIAGGTAPYGDPPGQGRMSPVIFTRELLCLHGRALRREACPDPVHVDAFDHHPYALTPTVHAFSRNDVSVPDFGRLQRVVRTAVRDKLVLPAGPKPYWVTEISWGSNPPDTATKVTLATQARYLSEAFYAFWHQGISHVFWLLIRDDAASGLNGQGVYFAGGRAKPAQRAFRFPFVALRQPHHRLLVWGRAPGGGRAVEIQARSRRGWHTVRTVAPTRGGVFEATTVEMSHQAFRAVQGAVASQPFGTG